MDVASSLRSGVQAGAPVASTSPTRPVSGASRIDSIAVAWVWRRSGSCDQMAWMATSSLSSEGIRAWPMVQPVWARISSTAT